MGQTKNEVKPTEGKEQSRKEEKEKKKDKEKRKKKRRPWNRTEKTKNSKYLIQNQKNNRKISLEKSIIRERKNKEKEESSARKK